MHLLLCGVEGQVSHIQRAALLQQLLLLVTVSLQRGSDSFPTMKNLLFERDLNKEHCCTNLSLSGVLYSNSLMFGITMFFCFK